MPDASTKSSLFPRLGIGAGSLANAGGEAAFGATVRAAWQDGVRYFDTSAFYLGGESERRLGAALAAYPRDGLNLSTKIGRYQDHIGSSIDPDNKRSYFDYSGDATARAVARSLERLKVDRLDAVFIHDLDHRFCGNSYDDLFSAALTGAYPALRRLKAEGVVDAVGIAAMDWRACLQFSMATEVDVVMPAGELSLLRNGAAALLDHCLRFGIPWIAASPFNSGILATGSIEGAFYDMRPAGQAVLEQVRKLEAICRSHEVPLAAAAMQYPARHPAVSTVVFGAKSPEEFAETKSLLDLELPQSFWTEIEDFVRTTLDWEVSVGCARR